ncbi:MAG: bifunctional (p)ppGpp synthetase/guanosine-3',5'-bis(diphosphate) 3'-pyrophosphohydrolase [Oscillibacter sp.]|nr:bifunctional (p)ppGpp synthetase/guanosine-3',5'-bis(diphosphate) 3'-pyrophosphohydrolase [Oscillibacter sp.]
MGLVERALCFAAEAHNDVIRKNGVTPYILHPMEVAVIVGSIDPDPELIAAGLLHDTVEDTPVTAERIEAEFGPRVAALVAAETEDKMRDRPADETWRKRKEDSLLVLREGGRDVKILWLADKLSNMRAFLRDYRKKGDALWQAFNEKDPNEQAWYYRTVAALLSELRDTDAWQEYDRLVNEVFEGSDGT